MSVKEVKTYEYQCDRCGYVWFPRQRVSGDEGLPELPKTCPHCKSPYWNSPRKNKRPGERQSPSE